MEQLDGTEVPQPGKLRVASVTGEGAVTVSLAGELDLGAASEVDEALATAQADAAGKLVIDLAGLEFIDSTGLRVLLSAQRRAEDTGQKLVLRNPQAQVRRLFEIAGILELISVQSD